MYNKKTYIKHIFFFTYHFKRYIIRRMNTLTREKRKVVIATVRMTGVHRTTIQKLLVDLGAACSDYQDKTFRNLRLRHLQCDEIWSFVGCKEKHATREHKARGWGDIWTWTAIDAETKLIPCWYIGTRDAYAAYSFIQDLKSRLANRIQLTTDGHKVYLNAVEDAFGSEIDYAQLVKLYGAAPEGHEIRYSPAKYMGARKEVVQGSPDPKHVSSSYAERQNLTMRMSMRRFTRLTNGFSKKVENHEAALALYFMYYNFCRVHQTLRVTPAMEAKLTDHVWSIGEVLELLN